MCQYCFGFFSLLLFGLRECVICPYSSKYNSALKRSVKDVETGARLPGFESHHLAAM